MDFRRFRMNSEVFYHMSAFYESSSARGFRWDDPDFQYQMA